MNLKPFYLSAPSRSGSSLLIKVLNCTRSTVVINEPVNSVDIVNRDNIKSIFESLEHNLKSGFIPQRVGIDGSEVTDTYPSSSIKWGNVKRSIEGVEVIGIKKSFPAFSNKDYFRPFITEWPSFVQWMRESMNGAVAVIVRDPRFTMLSWKTTFDALKGSTEKQCIAWNTIASTILSSRKLGLQIIRYEDLTTDAASVVGAIAEHIGVEATLKSDLPQVSKFVFEDYLIKKGISVGAAEADFRTVERICGDIAKEFGYERMYI